MVAKLLYLAALAIALCGCQTPSYVGDENSPYYLVPPGSRLILQKALTIPADQLATYIQNGQVLPNNQVQRIYPFCKFELSRLANTARSVQPDEMVVTKTIRSIDPWASALAAPVLVAQNVLGFMVDPYTRPSIQAFSTRMDLRSSKQPDIFRLTCAQWGYPGADRHLSISEIRRTLGDVFTLRLPHE